MNRLEVVRTDTHEIALRIQHGDDERDATMVLGLTDAELLGLATEIMHALQENLERTQNQVDDSEVQP